MAKVEQQDRFVYDDKELSEFTKDQEDAQYIEIFEYQDLAEIQKKLEKFGLSLKNFIKTATREEFLLRGDLGSGKKKDKSAGKKAAKGEKDAPRPLYLVETENDRHEFYCLKEVLDFVREQAQKGMHIQRYKGLGEMNPQQLWETTMDPARRTILKVTLEDAVEVDKTFTMLMGDEVGPRREFIEANAHEVKDLDV